MNSPKNFVDEIKAKEIASNLYPHARKIMMIEHSADNIVALIDDECAVRFPGGQNAYVRGLYERHILKQLDGTGILTVPKILNEHESPPYVVTTFVPGHHIRPADVRTFSSIRRQEFAKTIASFAYAMHSSFELQHELRLRKELGLDDFEFEEPWPVYFKRVVNDIAFPSNTQDRIAKKCYSDWVALCDVSPSVVVHDDLHTENMMFEGDRLIGVLDFGDANVGAPEQDLRQLYRISEEVILDVVHEYESLSGRKLNVDAIKTWTVMKELADYIRRFKAGDTTHHSFKRTSLNLNTWFPEGEWGKGFDLSGYDGYQ